MVNAYISQISSCEVDNAAIDLRGTKLVGRHDQGAAGLKDAIKKGMSEWNKNRIFGGILPTLYMRQIDLSHRNSASTWGKM